MPRPVLLTLALLVGSGALSPRTGASLTPPSPLRIAHVIPAQIDAGAQATLRISGQGFAKGAYVSFSSPGVRVIRTRWQSASELEAEIEAGALAEPGAVNLYVSNPDGAAAEFAFTILAAASTPAPSAPSPLPGEVRTPAPGSPVVSSVKPAAAAPGSHLKVQVVGKNFAAGAKVAFSNPGILVDATNFVKPSKLLASVRVAAGAATGPGSLFVINPDGTEAEVAFTVSGGLAGKAGAAAARFDVLNLGEALSLLQSGGQPHGVLIVSGNKLEYDQGTKKVFAVNSSQIQEVALNQFFGINTGTFHIILSSGKTYNFIAASLTPSATQTIVNSLQKAFRLGSP